MVKFRAFRYWYYLRQGYLVYFSFIFAVVNTLTVTYFLAIEKAAFLKEIFPTFPIYAAYLVVIGVPLLVFSGYYHFKKVPAYKSEMETNIESNPYTYKLTPGHQLEVVMPFYLTMSNFLVKISKNEEISDAELEQLAKLQKRMEHLLSGGYVGISKRNVAFKDEDD